MRFRVWAPAASRVDVIVGEKRSTMFPAAGGWFESSSPHAAHGDDYAFSVDEGPPRPDPRSRWQPHGVHGPSRKYDHDRFSWSDDAWTAPALEDLVIYELHVGTFSSEGTFDGAIERLSHLVDLGITAVELMPVSAFAGDRGWGYDGVDLYAPHHAYGGPDGLKRLVDACHAAGLAAIVDVVYNHFGPAGNYLPEFGPYLTDRYATPWGDAVNFDGPDSMEVREFFIDNALMWLSDYHFDGIRIDAVHAILDTSALHFLEELGVRVNGLATRTGRRLYAFPESDLNDPRVVTPRALGGYGLDAQWSDDFHHSLHSLLTGERDGYYADFGRIDDLAKAIRNAYVYDGRYSTYRRRPHGRPPKGLGGHSFLGYLQNHDQVGNRARGERISHLVDVEGLKIGAALVLTAPFIPLLFMGEEWGAGSPFQYFTDHDAELGRLVSEGRRSEFAAFGWDPNDVPDPQDPDTYHRSKLDWAELDKDHHADLLEWYRGLISLRRRTPDLRDGRLDRVVVQHDEAEGWLVVRRGSVTIACNFEGEARAAPVDEGAGRNIVMASGVEPEVWGQSAELPARSVTIFTSE